MDLRSGQLYWPTLSRPLSAPPLDKDLACEALVVGGGISGAFAAHLLAETGIDVALIDRRPLGCGSTTASTALLMYEIDTMLTELGEHIGQASAQRAYRRCHRALDDIRHIVDQLDDHCDLAPRPSLYLASEPDDIELLKAEARARQAIEIDARFIDRAQLLADHGIHRTGAILSSKALEADPLRLTSALLRRAEQNGARLFADTHAEMLETDNKGALLRSDGGHWIRAQHLVFATGYETPAAIDGDFVKLLSTYALATQRLARTELPPRRPLIWEHGAPYFYARTTPDDRIICGGEDEEIVDPAQRDALLTAKTRRVLEKLHRIFPGIQFRAEYSWAGTFAQTHDGLPLIGSTPEMPRCYFALGYGGNGITFSLIAAQIIRGMIREQPDPDAEVFSFARHFQSMTISDTP